MNQARHISSLRNMMFAYNFTIKLLQMHMAIKAKLERKNKNRDFQKIFKMFENLKAGKNRPTIQKTKTFRQIKKKHFFLWKINSGKRKN